MFYVYKWFNVDNKEIFYIGKGCRNRYKQIHKRNKLFKEYYNSHNCNVEIIEYFEKEQDAFKKENELILYYKSIGQCSCNLDNGGIGGCNFSWNEDMKKYMSEYNPMKDKNQRERMSKNNPMKNKELSEKVAEKIRKPIIYRGEELTSNEIVEKYNVCITTAQRWAKRGYDTEGNPCYYKDETVPHKKINTCSKAIYVDDKLFDSLRQSADFLGIKDTSPLCKALKENRPYKGHIVKYANQ